MDRIHDVLSLLKRISNTRSKRHVLGGILVSVAFLCAGIELTLVTLKEEHKNDK